MKWSWMDGGGNNTQRQNRSISSHAGGPQTGEPGPSEILPRFRLQTTKVTAGEYAQKMTRRFILSPAIRVVKISPTVGSISCPEHFRRCAGSDQTEMTSSKAPMNLGSEPRARKVAGREQRGRRRRREGKVSRGDVLPRPLDGGRGCE